MTAKRRLPELVLIVGMLVVAGAAMSYAVRTTSWALDETIIKASALHYSEGLWNVFSDSTARATSRAYPLLIAPIIGSFDGDTGVRMARALNAILFVSTAIPVFLLAGRVLRSRWAAVAAALLAVACPWLTLTTVLFQENLAYPAFAWLLLAMVHALERKRWTADLLVIAAFALAVTARVQLAFVFAGWMAAVWIVAAAERDRSRSLVPAFARRAWRIAPATHVVFGGVLGALVVRALTDHLRADLRRLLGTYSEIQDRPTLSPDVSQAVTVEIAAYAIAVGIVAAGAALAWWAATARRHADGPAWRMAVAALCAVVSLAVITAYVQGGYLGDRTEERYYLYAFPVVWIGALAFVQDRMRAWDLVAGGGVLLLLVAAAGVPRPPGHESVFLAPASSLSANAVADLIEAIGLEGMTPRDGIFILGLLLVLGAAAVCRWAPRARLAAVIVVPAALQLALTGYAFAARDGKVPAIDGATGLDFAVLNWLDEAPGGDVTWLHNVRYPVGDSPVGGQLGTLFWNRSITSWANVPELGLPSVAPPLDSLPRFELGVDDRTGAVPAADGLRVVAANESPLLQFAGTRVAMANALELVELGRPARASWLARGLDIDGSVLDARPARIFAFPAPGGPRRIEVELGLEPAPTGATELLVTLAGERRRVRLEPGSPRAITVGGCATGPLRGRIEAVRSVALADGRPVGGTVVRATLRAGDAQGCR